MCWLSADVLLLEFFTLFAHTVEISLFSLLSSLRQQVAEHLFWDSDRLRQKRVMLFMIGSTAKNLLSLAHASHSNTPKLHLYFKIAFCSKCNLLIEADFYPLGVNDLTLDYDDAVFANIVE